MLNTTDEAQIKRKTNVDFFYSSTLFFSLSTLPYRRKINFFPLHIIQIVNGAVPLKWFSKKGFWWANEKAANSKHGQSEKDLCILVSGCLRCWSWPFWGFAHTGPVRALIASLPRQGLHATDCWKHGPIAILIQSLIQISCKSHRQTVSWPVIGTINPPMEIVAEGYPEEGMKGYLCFTVL